MKWKSISKHGYPKTGSRVLTYSGIYDKLDVDIVNVYRVLDAQFVRICKDVTHWMYLEKPDNPSLHADDLLESSAE